MCCETENSYAWPRPLPDARTGFDDAAGLQACQHCGEEFCKVPSPAASNRCQNHTRPCRASLAADGAGARRHVLRRPLVPTAALCYWAGCGGSRKLALAIANVASSIILLEQRGGACLAPGKWAPTGPSKGEAPQLQRRELASKMVPAWQTAVEQYALDAMYTTYAVSCVPGKRTPRGNCGYPNTNICNNSTTR